MSPLEAGEFAEAHAGAFAGIAPAYARRVLTCHARGLGLCSRHHPIDLVCARLLARLVGWPWGQCWLLGRRSHAEPRCGLAAGHEGGCALAPEGPKGGSR